jgi:ribosomal protein L10
LNTFFKFIEKEKTLSFNVGLLDNNIYDPTEMSRIAQLPGKNQLIGQIIGSLKSPANKLVYSMKFNMNKFVYILKEKAKKS